MSSDSRPLAKTFDDYRRLAVDPTLDNSIKSGDPTGLRIEAYERIVRDIIAKVPALGHKGKTIVDIGVGCGDVGRTLIEHSRKMEHKLVVSDAVEVLDQLPQNDSIFKVAGNFPAQCADMIERYAGKVDGVVIYSVLHYVFPGYDVISFLDRAMGLLAEGGTLLVGDIPNASMRRRFLASGAGAQFHKAYMKTSDNPVVKFNALEPDTIDDALVLGLLMRARNSGFHAYIVPQPMDLPFANRREDLLVVRP